MPAGNFAYYLFTGHFPEMRLSVDALVVGMEQRGFISQAARVKDAWNAHLLEMKAIEVAIAKLGTETLVREEHDTRVGRPDTEGHGGPRLEDYLKAEALPGSLPAVGIADEDLLDQNVRWWPTQEEGSTAHVGRVLFGSFFGPGEPSAPHHEDFRHDALFAPGGAQLSLFGAGYGIIKNAIPAREFIKRSIPQIETEWVAQFYASLATYEAERDAAVAEALAL